MTLTAERVNQLLAWRDKIEPAPRPLVLPDETKVWLGLDRLFARHRTGSPKSS